MIKAQFQLQPAVPGKDSDPDRFPNEGRKVLLFSDSRQRAAKLARDMSEASDISAARQLFAIAIKTMEEQTVEQSMNSLYDFFCLAAGQHHVHIFHAPERIKFAEDCTAALNNYNRSVKRGREYTPRFTIANAPVQMQEYLLRLFAGGYNTLYDSATSWIEPTDQALFDALDALEENNVMVTNEEFIDFFNAWVLSICDMSTAIGHTISDTIRLKVRPNYGGYGLDKDWGFSKTIREIMGWHDGNETEMAWKRILKEEFLDSAQPDNGKLYVDLNSTIKGTPDNLTMRGNMNILGSSNFTYILQDSPLTVEDRLGETVTFVDFKDTTTVVKKDIPTLSLGGMDILMTLHIDEAVQARVDLNENGSNYMSLEGGGDLSFQYQPDGNMFLNGRYSLISGELKYELPIIPLKTFHIQNGSYIEWTGNIMNPNMNIKASERMRASVSTDGNSSRMVNFDVGINLTNRLENLGFAFTLEAPDDGNMQNELASKSVEEKNKLAITMLVTGMYLTEDNTNTKGLDTNSMSNDFGIIGFKL